MLNFGRKVGATNDIPQLIRRQGLQDFLLNHELLRIRGLHSALLGLPGKEADQIHPPVLQPVCHLDAPPKYLRCLAFRECKRRVADLLLNLAKAS